MLLRFRCWATRTVCVSWHARAGLEAEAVRSRNPLLGKLQSLVSHHLSKLFFMESHEQWHRADGVWPRISQPGSLQVRSSPASVALGSAVLLFVGAGDRSPEAHGGQSGERIYGCCALDNTAAARVKNGTSGIVATIVPERVDGPILRTLAPDHIVGGERELVDGVTSCSGMPSTSAVKPPVEEHEDRMAYDSVIGPLRAGSERRCRCRFHHARMSVEGRALVEWAGRHSARPLGAAEMMHRRSTGLACRLMLCGEVS